MNAVEVTGPADGRPIVFLHGASANLAMWNPQVERLSDTFRCVAIDLPGHGARKFERFTLESGIEATRAAIEEHSGGQATVAGLSLGAYVGIATAAAHPELVSGLVASGAGVEFQGMTARVNRVQGRLLPAFGPLLGRAATKALTRITTKETAQAIGARGHSFSGAGQALRDLAGRDFHSQLIQYSGPVLMLMGERDKPNLKELPRMIDGVADVAVQVLEDSGHSCALSQPDRFAASVRRFINERVHPAHL